MEERPVDPRDTEIEISSPTYRVFFWRHESDDGDPLAFRCEEHELIDARDVGEVLEWAEANKGRAESFTAYVVVNRTLIRLSGRDPTATHSS